LAPRPLSGLTVSKEAVDALLLAAERRHVSRTRLLREAGLGGPPPKRFARLPCEHYERLWHTLEKLTSDPDLGLHVAEEFLLDGDSLFERGTAVGDNVRDLLRRLEKFVPLLNSNLILEVSDEPRGGMTVTVRHRLPSIDGGPVAHERVLANILVRVRAASGVRIRPSRVRLQHPRPPLVAEYRRLFGVAPAFRAGTSSLTLSAEDVARPLLTADGGLRTALDDVLHDLLDRVALPQTLSEAVRTKLMSGLATHASLSAIARALHMSSRTLQRKLKTESNTNFESIRDELRKHIALEAVTVGDTNLEITYRLGFRDESSFERAFKRWTGMSPSQYRRTPKDP
jgi:AraC-like DNA-binding protein